MISVADLLTQPRIPSNYYSPKIYVRGDLEMGLLENRRGDRLLAIPDTLVQAIYSGLEKETGQATRLVLFNCGRWWGRNFYNRFQDEVSDYYQKPLGDMSIAEFLQCLKQCWSTYGWGTIEFDQTHHQRGFLIVRTRNSCFAHQAPKGQTLPACSLEAGIFSSFFTKLASRELHCVQTSCESLNADCNTFVIGIKKRLDSAESMIENQVDHESIMARLCA
ncbi:MAG: V4R domain-containing protein [Synechococcales bacterium]|nr:V4R domain-containing protein [Synechococcales bacterium]